MSDDQTSFKDKKTSRREFLKLMGAGSVFLGLGAFGISNVLKNIGQASASIKAAPPILNNTRNYTSNNSTNNVSNINSADIRPFNVNVPEEELVELRRRINATRWPERELVNDISQNVTGITVPNSGHYIPEEQPDVVVNLLNKFFSSNSTISSK